MARKRVFSLLLAALSVAGAFVVVAQAASAGPQHASGRQRRAHSTNASTATPIKHLVVIFQENVSFDHYFGTYPHAANTDGQPFHASRETPTVNGLSRWLRTRNPNQGTVPGGPANPQRLTYQENMTCDQDHGYTHEQQAFDMGIMDQFVKFTGRGLTLKQCLTNEGNTAAAAAENRPNNYAVMDYYDGNVVTGLWNYAQHFAMSDNSWSDGFGPSTPGAINVESGNTYGAICGPASAVINTTPCPPGAPGTVTPPNQGGTPQGQGPGTTYSDADPYYDVCSGAQQDNNNSSNTIQTGGTNIGDLLNQGGVTWGWFQGGFASPNYVPGQPGTDDPSQVCKGAHNNMLGNSVKDYSPHHEPFQYYASTSNPQHLPPASIAAIGTQADKSGNHQYDLKDFWAAADHGNMPAVSYLKAAEYQDGHAGYSDPLDEQKFLTETINHLEQLPSWKSTAVVILYDDSDGWYDHQMGPILNQSQSSIDNLNAPGQCGGDPARVPTTDGGTPEQGRCGVGQRQPLLVISPFSRRNSVDNHLTTQASVVKFIEDNWLGRQRIGNGSDDALTGSLNHLFSFREGPSNSRLFLDPTTGEPTNRGHAGHGDDGYGDHGRRR